MRVKMREKEGWREWKENVRRMSLGRGPIGHPLEVLCTGPGHHLSALLSLCWLEGWPVWVDWGSLWALESGGLG